MKFTFSGNEVVIEPVFAFGFMFGRKPEPIKASHSNY